MFLLCHFDSSIQLLAITVLQAGTSFCVHLCPKLGVCVRFSQELYHYSFLVWVDQDRLKSLTHTHTRMHSFFIRVCCQPKIKMCIFLSYSYHPICPRDFLGEPLPLFLLRYKAVTFSVYELISNSNLFCFIFNRQEVDDRDALLQ